MLANITEFPDDKIFFLYSAANAVIRIADYSSDMREKFDLLNHQVYDLTRKIVNIIGVSLDKRAECLHKIAITMQEVSDSLEDATEKDKLNKKVNDLIDQVVSIICASPEVAITMQEACNALAGDKKASHLYKLALIMEEVSDQLEDITKKTNIDNQIKNLYHMLANITEFTDDKIFFLYSAANAVIRIADYSSDVEERSYLLNQAHDLTNQITKTMGASSDKKAEYLHNIANAAVIMASK